MQHNSIIGAKRLKQNMNYTKGYNEMKKFFNMFRVNSPVVLSFTLLCLVAYGLNIITHGVTNRLFFCVYRSSLLDPLFYVRLIGHVVGHVNWEHLSANLMYILLLGPLLEEKYGSSTLAIIFLLTAVVTGIVNVVFTGAGLLGASGIVFALIILSSITSVKDRKIPVTFAIVVLIYIGGQIVDGITIHDNVSNMTHIIGGVIGAGCGYALLNKNR